MNDLLQFEGTLLRKDCIEMGLPIKDSDPTVIKVFIRRNAIMGFTEWLNDDYEYDGSMIYVNGGHDIWVKQTVEEIKKMLQH